MLSKISNILFDLDGTLTDPGKGITRCIQYALKQLDRVIPPSEQLAWCVGPPLKSSFSHLLNTTDPAILDRALVHYRKRFSEKGMFENILYTGVVSSLGDLQKAGFSLFLATSKPRVFAQQILDHFKISRFFRTVYGSELDGRLSDKGALIAHIIDQEKLDTSTTLMVGDRVYDIEGGKENKVMTAAVVYGYGTQDEITAADPDVIFETIADLTKTMLGFSYDFNERHLRRR
jgi:phosphoglycolate phosphatase